MYSGVHVSLVTAFLTSFYLSSSNGRERENVHLQVHDPAGHPHLSPQLHVHPGATRVVSLTHWGKE